MRCRHRLERRLGLRLRMVMALSADPSRGHGGLLELRRQMRRRRGRRGGHVRVLGKWLLVWVVAASVVVVMVHSRAAMMMHPDSG